MNIEQDQIIIEPQEGYQTLALSSEADIVIGGGAAGAGKSFVLLLEPLRHKDVRGFGGVIFRRTSPMIRAEGGLWDASMKLYTKVIGANPVESRLEWNFGPETKLKFSHLEYEKNIFDWQGAEIPFIGFDELTHFTETMFFYLLSRNRSMCGVRPYVRATCNPDPDSWVAKLIEWWIGPDGFPIPERRGVVRYFMRHKGKYIWGDTKQEVIQKAWHILEPMVERAKVDPDEFVKSITFIGGTIYENKALLATNPSYLGNLNSQNEEIKAQLLDGNWHIKVSDRDIYDFHKFANIFTNVHVKNEIEEAKARLAKNYSRRSREEIEADQKLVRRRITADIALKGSDKLFAIAWEGKMMIDFVVYAKSSGPQVIGAIKGLAIRKKIPNSEILFDNDGVGQFVDGYIEGAIEFNNGSKPIGGEFYNHLKSQCYYKSGDAVGNGEYYCPPEVADKKFDEDYTLKERMLFERKAIKRDKPDDDGKLQVIRKKEMRIYLNGESPDVLDAFMMREYFELHDPIIHATPDEEIYNINY